MSKGLQVVSTHPPSNRVKNNTFRADSENVCYYVTQYRYSTEKPAFTRTVRTKFFLLQGGSV
jgi:hypothetical protein